MVYQTKQLKSRQIYCTPAHLEHLSPAPLRKVVEFGPLELSVVRPPRELVPSFSTKNIIARSHDPSKLPTIQLYVYEVFLPALNLETLSNSNLGHLSWTGVESRPFSVKFHSQFYAHEHGLSHLPIGRQNWRYYKIPASTDQPLLQWRHPDGRQELPARVHLYNPPPNTLRTPRIRRVAQTELHDHITRLNRLEKLHPLAHCHPSPSKMRSRPTTQFRHVESAAVQMNARSLRKSNLLLSKLQMAWKKAQRMRRLFDVFVAWRIIQDRLNSTKTPKKA